MDKNSTRDKVRIDRWLWAARFFKTRSQAAQAVSGGHVQINGVRQKPSHQIACGDELRIRRGEDEFVVIVLGLAEKRGSASVARLLYEETAASLAAREAAREQRRLLASDQSAPPRRPSKRDRRLIRSFTGKD